MYVCILSQDGEVVLHRNMQARPDALLKAIAPYRDNIVIAVACLFTWYWLADLCAQEGLPFVLGHALYMKAIYGGKAKTTRSTPRKSLCCSVGACSRRLMSIPQRCGRPETSSGAACI